MYVSLEFGVCVLTKICICYGVYSLKMEYLPWIITFLVTEKNMECLFWQAIISVELGEKMSKINGQARPEAKVLF